MPRLSRALHHEKKKKHYRPPGKKKEGNAAKFITRTRAVHALQLSLPMFRS